MNSSRTRPVFSAGSPCRSLAVAALSLVVAAIAIPGCGEPQVDSTNRELVLRLATATSARDQERLEAAAAEIDRRRIEGTIDDAVLQAFEAIIEAARSGDWEYARRRSYALRDGQRPSNEDLDRVRRRTMPTPKTRFPPPESEEMATD